MIAELVLEKEQLDCGDYVSWSAYHANRHVADMRPVSQIVLKPLFTEAEHRAAMMVHSMKLSV